MDRPTTQELRDDPRMGPFLEANGFPVGDDTYLQEEITLAWGYVESRTCRDLDALDPIANEALAIIAKRAVYLRLMQSSIQESPDYSIDSLNDLIKSFAVPGYSETRRDGVTSLKDSWMLNPLPALNDLLRALITQECWDAWIQNISGDDLPASTILEVGWFIPPYSN